MTDRSRAAGLVLVLGLWGCATTRAPLDAELHGETRLLASAPDEWATLSSTPPAPPPFELPGLPLVERAGRLVGRASLHPVAPHLPDDCTGLARVVYEQAGVELLSAAVHGDNGVTAIYRLALAKDALHTDAPAPGDLVFFAQTYDRNRDGKLNDGLTHIGVVEAVDEDGTVTFVHRVGGGVKRGRLNPRLPLDGKRNDWLRPARPGVPARRTGELFVTFGAASGLLQTLHAER